MKIEQSKTVRCTLAEFKARYVDDEMFVRRCNEGVEGRRNASVSPWRAATNQRHSRTSCYEFQVPLLRAAELHEMSQSRDAELTELTQWAEVEEHQLCHWSNRDALKISSRATIFVHAQSSSSKRAQIGSVSMQWSVDPLPDGVGCQCTVVLNIVYVGRISFVRGRYEKYLHDAYAGALKRFWQLVWDDLRAQDESLMSPLIDNSRNLTKTEKKEEDSDDDGDDDDDDAQFFEAVDEMKFNPHRVVAASSSSAASFSSSSSSSEALSRAVENQLRLLRADLSQIQTVVASSQARLRSHDSRLESVEHGGGPERREHPMPSPAALFQARSMSPPSGGKTLGGDDGDEGGRNTLLQPADIIAQQVLLRLDDLSRDLEHLQSQVHRQQEHDRRVHGRLQERARELNQFRTVALWSAIVGTGLFAADALYPIMTRADIDPAHLGPIARLFFSLRKLWE
jgi:hypothetical protein